ncbi:MAG: hypothetical protein CMK60_02080 [Proteobacteria bacterium]|jgi:uncharacterized membrane protein YgdD (TMEM256/DUF423 family)|nr:hypothetical protein [Pseudomonadota bacterium]MBP11624.1 hypothetical protein [Acidiferrobacteraceae bacterium]MDP6137471.1 DUF423 domain-containing protein [Arenicellales bacterium]HCF72297.1 DUF423 domain-containing protein [Gammaproteobacteria bacterium]MDP7221512.1 DUF423 domain-containing protein [Arenicellales bacterium]
MRVFLFLAAILGAVAVLAGAVGAHVWRDELLARNSLANFQLATDYLFYHALGIAVVALLVDRFPAQKLQSVGWCMAAGTAVFSGSLLVFSLTGFQSITAITPMGGILLIAGWLLLAWRTARWTALQTGDRAGHGGR